MVFGSTMLEVAIGLIFVYLLMSLLCSAFNELINAAFKLRSRDLEKGIKRLLSDPKLSQEFFKHPLIRPLYEGRKPSYIPARTFSLALWNMATAAAEKSRLGEAATPAPKGETGAAGEAAKGAAGKAAELVAGVTRNLPRLRETIIRLPESQLPVRLKQSLVTLIDEADNDFDKARRNIEKWYNDSMDRVSGAFKRRAHYILLGLGFALALVMNVDSFNIIKVLTHNDDLRKAVAAAAENYVKAPLPGTTPTPAATPTPSASPAATASPATSPAASTAATPAATPTDEERAREAQAQFDAAKERVKQIRGQIYELGLPIGWDCGWRDPAGTAASASGASANTNAAANRNAATNANVAAAAAKGGAAQKWRCASLADSPRGVPDGWVGWILKLAGIFLTGLAVSQGAPFWFDLLNKFIVIRSTVKPREKSREQPSKDRPAPDTETDEADADDEEGDEPSKD